MAKSRQCPCTLGNDIVKQGYLYVKRPPRPYWSRLKAWHRRFIVLRDETRESGPLLEMFATHESVCTSHCHGVPQVSIDLSHAVHIGFSGDSSRHPYALLVVCQGRSPLLLAVDDELSARSWILALGLMARKGGEHSWRLNYKSSELGGCNHLGHCCNEVFSQDPGFPICDSSFDTGLYSLEDGELTGEALLGGSLTGQVIRERFPVMVHSTEDSERSGLRDDAQLVIFNHGIGVAKAGDADCLLYWPVAGIRQYKHESLARGSGNRVRTTLITLEVGRRCSTGEGTFQFRTQQGQEIIQEIRRMVSYWSSKRVSLSTATYLTPNVAHRHCKTDISRCCPTTAFNNRGSKVNTPCRSAPATPSLLTSRFNVPSASSVRICGGETATKRTSPDEDLNYIVPVFDRSCDSADEEFSFSKTSPFARKRPSTLSPSFANKGNHSVNSDECGKSKSSAPSSNSREHVDSKSTDPPMMEDRDYLEVLPNQ